MTTDHTPEDENLQEPTKQAQYFRTYIDDPVHGIIHIDCQIGPPIEDTPELQLARLYETFGRAVLLPLPCGTKSPTGNAWQSVTYDQSMTPEYQAELLAAIKRGGNIGVLLGPASGHLHAIDIDDDDFVEPFLTLTPQLARITQTRGAKGCQLFFRPKPGTIYPKDQAFYPLKTRSGQKWGEWRCGESGGAQSVIFGIHPLGNQYHVRCATAVDLYLQDFARINWPPEVILPWAKAEQSPPPSHLDMRIRAYLDTVDIAVEGEGGSNPTFRVACLLVNGFALDGEQALHYLRHYSETRCWPSWSEPEMRHKIADALKASHPRPRGHLLGAEPEPEDERITKFSQSIIKGPKLLEIKLPPKKMIIDDWFKEGDLGFIFAYRGAGKTWLTLDLCAALAGGTKCGPWAVNGKWPTLYIDGEMSHDDDKSRILGLSNPIPENLYVLNHEVLFHYHKLVMNFGNAGDQNIITQICLDKGIKVLVLDNLGCLVSGVEENKADEWEKMLPWLLELRRQGISVIIVHHSGHDSTRMRGTVKREDSAAWVLRLDDQREDYSEAGAHFITRFRKLRGDKPALDYEWWYQPSGGGVLVTFKEANRASIVLQWVRDGLSSCSDIAQEMGVTKGAVSKLANQLIKEGKLKKNARDYMIP